MKLKGDLIVTQDSLEECDLQAVQVNETKLLLESKLRRIEESYKKERGALEQHATAHDREMDSLESRLIELRDISSEESRAVNAKRQCGELKSNIMGNREKHERKKSDMNQAVMTAASALADYKEQLQQRLAEVKSMTERRLESVLQMGSDDSLPSLPPSAYSVRNRDQLSSSLRSMGKSTSSRLGPFESITKSYATSGSSLVLAASSPDVPPSVSLRYTGNTRSVRSEMPFPPAPPSSFDEV